MTEITYNKAVPRNFIPDIIDEEQYVLGDGNLEAESLMPTGHGWGNFLPLEEPQSRLIETSCCPAYGTLNAVEAIGRKKYGASFQSDLSDRYLSIMSGMDGHGGNPHYIAEIMRTVAGAIPEVFLPFTNGIKTLRDFFTPRPMSYSLFKVGYNWRQKYDFKHQWVFTSGTVAEKQAKMKQALKQSPLGVAGYAWSLHSDGKYYKDGPDIHWFTVFDYVEGEYWWAFDSYFPYVKKLDWNYDFGYAKSYSLTRRLGATDDSVVDASAVMPYAAYIIKWLITSFKK